MKGTTAGGVGWIQIVEYQFNSAGNWELLKIMGRYAIRLHQTSNMDHHAERTELEAGNQIRLREQSRYQVMKAWINIVAMIVKESWTGSCD